MAGPPRLYSDEERKERHRASARECQRRKRAAVLADPELLAQARDKERARSKRRRTDCPEQIRAAEHRRYLKRKEEAAGRSRLRHTGWTRVDFERAWVAQEGRCSICEIELDRKGTKPHSATADHDHDTGAKRGLLCRRCNLLEGHHLKSPLDVEEWAKRLKTYRLRYQTGPDGLPSQAL